MDIARHFTLAELTHSNTAKAEGIPNQPGPAAVEALRALCAAVLDPLREALGKSITINCAYRGPVLNKRVGGVANSQHITGQAADMQATGVTVLDLFKLTIQLGLPFDQVIYEARSATSKWLHVSHVAPAQGSNRGEIRVAKFGPDGKAQSYPLITPQEALAMSERATRSRAQVLTYEEMADEPALVKPRAPARKAPVQRTPVQKTPALKTPARKKAAGSAPVAKAAAKKVAQKPVAQKRAPAKQASQKRAAAKTA